MDQESQSVSYTFRGEIQPDHRVLCQHRKSYQGTSIRRCREGGKSDEEGILREGYKVRKKRKK